MPKIGHSSRKKDTDNDSVNNDENKQNKRKCELAICGEENVSSKEGSYILALCGTQDDTEFRIAAACSNYSSAVYTIGETITKVATFNENDSPIVGIKFSPVSRNILYTAMRNGFITACDLRAKKKIVATIKDSTPDGKFRPFSSFDISNDDRFAVAGSEHVGGDAFILFWDLRYNNGRTKGKCDLLGGYWESHIDDITTLSFHPKQQDFLASGSTDGLINVFDLRKNSEELALKYSLNTESSVDRLGWLDNGNIWCTTHTHGLQLWDCKDAEPYAKFERKALENCLSSDMDTSYVVKMHKTNVFGRPFLLAGSTTVNGELSGLSLENGNLETCYDLPGNKQLVRDSWYHEKTGCLVTGGEMGVLNLWRENDTTRLERQFKTSTKLSGKKRDKQARSKPY